MTLPPAVVFLLFVVVSFLMLRYVLQNFATEARAIYAPPALIFAGAISGVLFFPAAAWTILHLVRDDLCIDHRQMARPEPP